MLGWPLKIKQTKKIVAKQTVFLVAIFLFTLFILPYIAHAQTVSDVTGLTQVGEATGLGAEDIRLTIAKIIRVLLGLLGIIALSLMLYAGYTIMTSAGEADKVDKGKKILLNATIGLVIILSSFGIVQFFITKLGEATGFGGRSAGSAAARQTFLGSGSLGRIVKDHYPFRDQRDVPRNTRISVTFNYAFDPTSVFDDKNAGAANGIFGDCINTALPTFNWNTDCDHLKVGAINIYALDTDAKETGAVLDMTALASDEGGKFFTVVLRPVQPLGNDQEPVGYSVDLTKNILKETGGGMFVGAREDHYKWVFHTGTVFDFDPPIVTGVYPKTVYPANPADPFDKFPRNTVLQVNFSEPMDPTVTQGRAGSFSHIIVNNTETNAAAITGAWRISNGYSTTEFVSDQACGENSCGDPMYCLPITCTTPDCSETHSGLIRTADLISLSSWESAPFSGVTDMSGNALDGDRDGVQDNKPTPSGAGNILSNEKIPDNFFWDFEIENKIDRSAPYIQEIKPGIDEEDVAGDADNAMKFSKAMWAFTLGGIEIEEKIKTYTPARPAPAELWYRSRGQINPDNNTTWVTTSHRIFGPNDEDAYYFTSVSSTVKSLNQNCIYPGRGPDSAISGTSPICTCTENVNGALNCSANCVGVLADDADKDTGCVLTNGIATDKIQPDIATCLDKMDDLSQFNSVP